MDIKSLALEMDGIVAQGAIVDAVQRFFANDATTSDYNGVATTDKAQMVEKMKGFAEAIAQDLHLDVAQRHHVFFDVTISVAER